MLRRGCKSLVKQYLQSQTRYLSTSQAVFQESKSKETESEKQFLQWYLKNSPPGSNQPTLPRQFLKNLSVGDTQPASANTKLKLSLLHPNRAITVTEEVDSVQIPTTSGVRDIMAGQTTGIFELTSGILSILKDGKEEKNYFISSGYCFVNEDHSAQVNAVELVELNDLDPESVKRGFNDANQKVNALQGKGPEDYDLAIAQVQLDTYFNMGLALGISGELK